MLVVSPLDAEAVARAATSGADAIVIDLAQGPAAHRRGEARAALRESVIPALTGCSSDVLLWTDAGGVADDLDGCEPHGIAGVIASLDAPQAVAPVDAALARFEAAHGLAHGSLGIEVAVSSVTAFHAWCTAAAAGERIAALVLDEQNVTRNPSLSARAREDMAAYCRGALVVSARMLGIQAHGSSPSGTGVLAGAYATAARRMGLRGALCTDPAAVPMLNAAFSPSADEVESARRTLDAMDAAVAEGRGAISASAGTMADLANVRQAQAVVDRAEAIHLRNAHREAAGGASPPAEGSASRWP